MSEPSRPAPRELSRRTVLRALSAGAGAVALLPWLSDDGMLAYTEVQRRNAPPRPKALSLAQFATLEALVDAIIPADERSPGAKAARVPDYIDLLLSESTEEFRRGWLDGLNALEADATARFGSSFARLGPVPKDTVMTEISRYEMSPVTPLEFFFVAAKQATIQGYYTSEIGIHRELQYKGNQMLVNFVGCATEDGKDCPHCRQKAAT
ncbi:MAG: gluconate 2-dehydrogenase subunit 3 family protein [Vicinamibacterales bacterium]